MVEMSVCPPRPVKIFLISLIFALFACGFSPIVHADPPVILRVGGEGAFRLPSKNATDPQSRADRAIVDAFESSHPGIRLESAQGLQISGPASEASLLMQFAGGSAPDVVYVNFRSSATYISQGFLIPLDSYINQDPSVMQRLNPVVRKVLYDVGQGHVYSLPYAQLVQGLYYRKDLFEAAGLDPDKPPTTWDEFYTDAQKLTNQDQGQWGFEFGSDPGAEAYWWINFLWQAGGDVVQRNPQGKWVAVYDSPSGVVALDFFKKLMTAPWKGPNGKTYKGVARATDSYTKDRGDGKVGMWFAYQSNVIANTTDASTLNPSIVGIAPMPKGPTGISANEVNAAMWGISSQTTDPKVRAAAWEFIKFMGSDEADRIRTQAYVEAGLGDTINPVSLAKYGYAEDSTPASRAWLAANKTLFLDGHPEPYGDNMNEIYILMGSPLAAVVANPNANSAELLAQSAREVNTKLTGYVPPAIMHTRRVWAWSIFWGLVCLLTAIAGFQLRMFTIKRALRTSGEIAADSGPKVLLRTQILSWFFMAPAVLAILIWSYYPLGRGLVIAFENYQIIYPPKYVGLDNFIDIVHQPSFWAGVRGSFLITFYSLSLGFALPIILALGLSEIPTGKVFFRSLYYLPAVTSTLVVAFLWKWLEDGTPNGLLNTILASASRGHIGPINWLGDPHWAMFSVVLPSIWAAAGPGCIIYLAALRGISDEMYEAAELDGAGIWTKIWKITIPTLRPLIYINLLGATIGAFKSMDTIFAMTGGGPQYATHTLGLEVFYNSFLYLRFGAATAAAWIMGMMLVGFTFMQLRMMRDMRFSAAKN